MVKCEILKNNAKIDNLAEFDNLPYLHQLTEDGVKQLELVKNRVADDIRAKRKTFREDWIDRQSTKCYLGMFGIPCASLYYVFNSAELASKLGIRLSESADMTLGFAAVLFGVGVPLFGGIAQLNDLGGTDTEPIRKKEFKEYKVREIIKLDKDLRDMGAIPQTSAKPKAVMEWERSIEYQMIELTKHAARKLTPMIKYLNPLKRFKRVDKSK